MTYDGSQLTTDLYLDGEHAELLTAAVQLPLRPAREVSPDRRRRHEFLLRLRGRFPELVEFWELFYATERATGYDPFPLEPAEWARPKEAPCRKNTKSS